MGLGYVIGCLTSILLWNIDRRKIFITLNNKVERRIKKSIIIEFLYLLMIAVLFYLFSIYRYSEIINAVTTFVAIDISNTEKKNLSMGDRTHFYDSISLISKALIGGFIAPLFYIIVLGNNMGIAYAAMFNIVFVKGYRIIRLIFNILTIIPALLAHLLLYIVYIARNRRLTIDFKGDYLVNCITRPLLNIDIFGAYIESVNFYYYFHDADIHYVKSYGEYSSRIDLNCVKDYLSIAYGIAMVYFVFFFVIQRAI